MFKPQYIACNTDMYDTEAFTIYNVIEAITIIIRECYATMKRLEIVTRSYQTSINTKFFTMNTPLFSYIYYFIKALR